MTCRTRLPCSGYTLVSSPAAISFATIIIKYIPIRRFETVKFSINIYCICRTCSLLLNTTKIAIFPIKAARPRKAATNLNPVLPMSLPHFEIEYDGVIEMHSGVGSSIPQHIWSSSTYLQWNYRIGLFLGVFKIFLDLNDWSTSV